MKNMTREQARMLGDALGNEYNKEGLMRFADMLFGMMNAPFGDSLPKEAKPAPTAAQVAAKTTKPAVMMNDTEKKSK